MSRLKNWRWLVHPACSDEVCSLACPIGRGLLAPDFFERVRRTIR